MGNSNQKNDFDNKGNIDNHIVLDDIAKDKKTINRHNKASLMLFIIGIILSVVAVVLLGIYGDSIYKHLINTDENKLGTTLVMVINFSYFGFPGIILSAVSCILFIIAVSISKDKRIIKIVFMILSILLIILYIIFIILMQN